MIYYTHFPKYITVDLEKELNHRKHCNTLVYLWIFCIYPPWPFYHYTVYTRFTNTSLLHHDADRFPPELWACSASKDCAATNYRGKYWVIIRPAITNSITHTKPTNLPNAVRYIYFHRQTFVHENIVWRTPLGAVTSSLKAIFSDFNWMSWERVSVTIQRRKRRISLPFHYSHKHYNCSTMTRELSQTLNAVQSTH